MSRNFTEIHRETKTENYSMISNEVLRRKDISWKAKGIMAYILSLPNDWTIYLEELEKHATDGRDSFRTGWNELKDKGYVQRSPVRDKGKIIAWKTTVKEKVDVEEFPPHTEFPYMEKPLMEKPHMDNPKLQSTNSTNNLSIQKTNSTKRTSPPSKKKYGEMDNVLLNDSEMEKLKDKFPNDYEERIDKLSLYIAQKGKKYKSHYATILSWARKDDKQEKSANNGKQNDMLDKYF